MNFWAAAAATALSGGQQGRFFSPPAVRCSLEPAKFDFLLWEAWKNLPKHVPDDGSWMLLFKAERLPRRWARARDVVMENNFYWFCNHQAKAPAREHTSGLPNKGHNLFGPLRANERVAERETYFFSVFWSLFTKRQLICGVVFFIADGGGGLPEKEELQVSYITQILRRRSLPTLTQGRKSDLQVQTMWVY